VNPGSIVSCRNRDWVLLPSDQDDVYRLRPLTGATDEVVLVHKGLSDLIGSELPEERVRSATFPPPTPADLSDAAGAHLLWQAARLTLREGAMPFRSLGRISVRPRVYQFVPLLMALRLDPVRLLIADDVGVGKTIEALLVARELYERGEIRRICVLCPPYLCDQWQKEMAEKFGFDPEIIRSGTVGQLDRHKVGHDSIYRYYPIQVASIDFLKRERNKHAFLQDCPDLIILDEAHGSAASAEGNQAQHQRHKFVAEIAANPKQHLILLTATPHSGIEGAFQSLLGHVRPEFATLDVGGLDEAQRVELARHFVQRTRRDIERDWEGEHCFPTRESTDETYRLSTAYKDLFERTYEFCSEIVQTGQALDGRHQRVRYWGALALLRCVMSSPAAAVAALETRTEKLPVGEEDLDARPSVFESTDDRTDDEQPTAALERVEAALETSERRQLRDLGRMAGALLESADDTKLGGCAELVKGLLRGGFHPIVWCRYIATAEYVAKGLKKALGGAFPDLSVAAITGRMGDDERRERVRELSSEPRRVLVATDCLSEGINLQGAFSAALHYDLPWNPNRLEQREGRVDRYGQTAKVVRAVRYFGQDNPVDGVVIDVLLNKAREIRRALGTYMPVPEESESVTEAVLQALFLRGRGAVRATELPLDLGVPAVAALHRRMDDDAEREKTNRTRFAQRALKPAEVQQELEATDAVLGDPEAVREFVLAAAQRLGLSIAAERESGVFRVAVGDLATKALPEVIRLALPQAKSGPWRVSFVSPTPEGAEYVGRNHPFVATLARYLLEEALTKPGEATAARCGVIRTHAVERLTTLFLLRVRYLLHQPERATLLAEEVLPVAFRAGVRGGFEILSDGEALRLLAEATPAANVPQTEKRERIDAALAAWEPLQDGLRKKIRERAVELEKSHKRVRQAVSLRVRELALAEQWPPDLLGVLVLQPVTKEGV
jgi:superfamily II DNA or RNA helicase